MNGSPPSNGLRSHSSSWPRWEPRPRPGRPSLPSGWNDVDRFRFRIEHDLRFTALELGVDVGKLLLEREVPRAIFSAFAQHKSLDETAQRLDRQLLVGDEHRFLIAHRFVQ